MESSQVFLLTIFLISFLSLLGVFSSVLPSNSFARKFLSLFYPYGMLFFFVWALLRFAPWFSTQIVDICFVIVGLICAADILLPAKTRVVTIKKLHSNHYKQMLIISLKAEGANYFLSNNNPRFEELAQHLTLKKLTITATPIFNIITDIAVSTPVKKKRSARKKYNLKGAFRDLFLITFMPNALLYLYFNWDVVQAGKVFSADVVGFLYVALGMWLGMFCAGSILILRDWLLHKK